jgi:hypothetical protein
MLARPEFKSKALSLEQACSVTVKQDLLPVPSIHVIPFSNFTEEVYSFLECDAV